MFQISTYLYLADIAYALKLHQLIDNMKYLLPVIYSTTDTHSKNHARRTREWKKEGWQEGTSSQKP